jgi:hypothetical protein
MHIDVFKIFKKVGEGKTIWLYPAKETEIDPYEHNTQKSFLNPIPIRALIKTLSPASLRWKFFGTLPIGSKEVIIESKYKNLALIADKIKIDDDYYYVWKDDERNFGILEREDYIVLILHTKGINQND